MKKTQLIFGVLTAWLVASCSQTHEVKAEDAAYSTASTTVADDDDDEEDEHEEDVAIEEVPAALKAAARAAVPGFVPFEAEKETSGDTTLYCIHGHVGAEFVEVEVDLDGNVLEIERGEDDEDD